MKYSLILPLVLISLLFTAGCGGDDDVAEPKGTFELNFITRVSGEGFQNRLIYQNINGRKFFIENMKMYVGNITLVKEDDTEVKLSDVELFDLGNGGVANKVNHGEGSFAIFEGVEPGNYKGVKFGIGVPPELNRTVRPSDFEEDEPLADLGMWWSWLTGYRFLSIDGRIDTTQANLGENFQGSLVYHTGIDELYRELEFTDARHAFTLYTETEKQFFVEIDFNRLFFNDNDTINMVVQNQTHSTPKGSDEYKLAEKITDNLVNGALFGYTN
ncbi:MAG: MbnP family protein [Bacteroidota bacterium]